MTSIYQIVYKMTDRALTERWYDGNAERKKRCAILINLLNILIDDANGDQAKTIKYQGQQTKAIYERVEGLSQDAIKVAKRRTEALIKIKNTELMEASALRLLKQLSKITLYEHASSECQTLAQAHPHFFKAEHLKTLPNRTAAILGTIGIFSVAGITISLRRSQSFEGGLVQMLELLQKQQKAKAAPR